MVMAFFHFHGRADSFWPVIFTDTNIFGKEQKQPQIPKLSLEEKKLIWLSDICMQVFW